MATITASLEQSLQNCSLNQTTRTRRGNGGGVRRSETVNRQMKNSCNNSKKRASLKEESNASSSDDNSTLVELNSHLSLPYHWEQCLDLKTGEIYYLNWRNGMRAKEDPRTIATGYNGDYYSEDEDEDEEDDEDEDEESNCYDSEGSSTESSSCSSNRRDNDFKLMKKNHHNQQELKQDSVLVVAGCKSCLMYYMVAKYVEDCPKCSGQLLHFAANNSSP